MTRPSLHTHPRPLQPGLVTDRFEAQAARTPTAIALQFGDRSLSYRELDERANQLARELHARGVGPEQLVGISAEQSFERWIAVVAVMKAGGAFVPLDPTYPEDRLAYMIKDSGLQVILDGKEAASHHPASAPRRQIRASNLAYVIYTSGSTGRPKGVLVSHAGLCNLADAQIDDFQVTAESRVLQFASFSFDASVSELLMALLAGATLVLAERDDRMPGPPLTKLIAAQRISVVTLPPSTLAHLEPSSLPTLRTLATAGEASSAEIVARWSQGRRLLNAYGPTEATVCATSHVCGATGVPPIGQSIWNAEVYIVGPAFESLPIGQAGELCIGGVGLARGYLGRPDLTADKFVPHPFGGAAGARLYKTGDRARFLPDGSIEYLGRIDHQVKLRGFRIELGEIESVLTEHPGVRDAVAMVHGAGETAQLAAYIIPALAAAPSIVQLREHLATRLPSYMIPQAFVSLATFPTTPAGKIDRHALPDPATTSQRRTDVATPPRDELERELVELWQSLLSFSPIGIHDDFFTLGGHSLLTVRLVAEIESRYSRRLLASALVETRTIAQLATLIRQTTDLDSRHLVPLQRSGTRPPLFLVHPISGNVMCYLELSRLLGPDQPLFGLQSRGFDSKLAPLDSVVTMATEYIAELKQIQPKGPYRIGGWSSGGIISFEMALQLVRAGDEVERLALIDARAPAIEASEHALAHRLNGFDDAIVAFWFVLTLWRCTGREVDAEYERNFRGRSGEQLLDTILEQLRPLGFLDAGHGRTQVKRLFDVYKGNLWAILHYEPKPYSGRLLLLQSEMDTEIRPNAPHPPPWGWEKHCSQIEVRSVPGNHFTVIYPPNVQRVAERLKSYLEDR